mgnify:CR=1 FL=1|jgi:hypothetical protein
MIKKLSIANRYTVADTLAAAFAPSIGKSFCTQSSKVQFGIIINRVFISKGVEQTLNTRYEFDIASHITNLVLRRLCSNNTPVEVDL